MTIFGSRMLTGGVLAVIGLITVKVLMALFGALAGFVSFLFSLIPILLIAWIGWKVLKSVTKKKNNNAVYE